jgi:hypothetical protein
METDGFLYSSMGVLGSFLWFLIQVLTLLTGTFSVSLPLLKVGKLSCVAMNVDPLIGQLCGGSAHVVWAQDFLGGMGSLVKADSLKWSCVELVCELLTAPTAHRASLGARIELFGLLLFSWKSVRFSSLPFSPRWWHVLFSPGCSAQHTDWIRSAFCTTPTRWRWIVPLIYSATSFVQRGCNLPTSCAGLCGSL